MYSIDSGIQDAGCQSICQSRFRTFLEKHVLKYSIKNSWKCTNMYRPQQIRKRAINHGKAKQTNCNHKQPHNFQLDFVWSVYSRDGVDENGVPIKESARFVGI